MEYSKYSPDRLSNPTYETGHFKIDQTPTRDAGVTHEMFAQLKKNYEERIRSLEAQVKETYHLVENDEIIQTMRLNQISDEYRRQRVQEIVEDALFSEKEIQIDRLNQLNAYLKSEILRAEDDKIKLKNFYEDENDKLRRKYDQLELALENQSKFKLNLEQECEKLASKLKQTVYQHDELNKARENQYSLNIQSLHEEIQEVQRQNEEIRNENYELQHTIAKKDSQIEEMRRDIEILKREYSRIEGSYQSLIADHNELSKNFNNAKETNFTFSAEIKLLNEKLLELEQEIGNKENDVRVTKREKDDLLHKSDQLQIQIKRVIEHEQKATNETLREARQKYKAKNNLLKNKLQEFKEFNDSIVTENTNLKQLFDDRKASYEKTLATMQNDMKIIKAEWEKKVQESELTSQRTIAEIKAKNQLQVSQLQNEYQTLLDKRLSEIHNEANSQMSRSRTIDLEIRTQLEGKVTQMERDFIPKSKHESVLTNELMELRTKHAQSMKDLEEKYEREIQSKTKETVEKKKLEYEALLSTLKNANKTLEEQNTELRSENKHLQEKLSSEKERSGRFANELAESEQSRKTLLEKIDQSTTYISKLKSLYEEETKKARTFEAEAYELQKRVDELTQKYTQAQGAVSELKQQNLNLTNSNYALDERVEELDHQHKHSSSDINIYKSTIEALSKEKEDLITSMKQLSQNLSHESQVTLEKIAQVRREESEKLEKETAAKLKLQSSLNQAEHQITLLTNDNADLEAKLKSTREEVSRAERKINEAQNAIYGLEAEKTKVEKNHADLQRKIEKLKLTHREEVQKLARLLLMKVSHLKTELAGLKKSLVLEVEMNGRSVIGSAVELVKHLRDKIRVLEDSRAKERLRELEGVNSQNLSKIKELGSSFDQERQNIRDQYERTIQGHVQSQEKLSVELDSVKAENNRLLKLLDDAHTEVSKLRGKIEKLQGDKETLQGFVEEKSREFASLQSFVEKEVKRIKQESENLLASSVKQIEEKHKRELAQLGELVEELKDLNIVRLQRVDTEVMKLHNGFIEDIEHTKQMYELRIENYDKELSTLEADYKTLKKEKRSCIVELEQLSERYQQLEEENRNALGTFDERIEQFKEIIRQDNEKYLQYKSEANSELEKIKKENKDLKRDLQARSQRVDELNRMTSEQEHQIKSLKVSIDEQVRSYESKQREALKLSRFKDKEMEDLQSLLSKSMKTFTSSIDHNVKIASKLDRETHELTKNIKSHRGTVNIIDEER